MTLIQELRRIRREKDISQDELSKLTGIDAALISRLENGKGNPTLKTIKNVGDALGIQLKWEKK